MAKIDLKVVLKHLYKPTAKSVDRVDVPPLRFLMIDGKGDPSSSAEYAQAVEALFSVSYTAKFSVKKAEKAIDYAVMPLEGLWWADDWSAFITGDRSEWQWTMMIMQPDPATDDVIADAIKQVSVKKDLPGIEHLRLETFNEGLAAQILHVGPFSEEGPTIERVHQYIDAAGSRCGKHHEIYLSDIRRGNPTNWKTIIRQPMQIG
jgi:hypothetical protein